MTPIIGTPTTSPTPLVTLSDYQTAVGSTNSPARQQLALNDAAQAVLNYTDRDFGTSDVVETRTFKYDGKGTLEIDDCSVVHSVNGVTVPVGNWIAHKEGPAAVTVYSWLQLPMLNISLAGEMGFSYNLDTFLRRLGAGQIYLTDIEVNATWGWPDVPNDVRRAVIFLAQEYDRSAESGSSGDVAGESVAEVSRQYYEAQFQSQTSAIQGLPERVADILWPYKRHSF